MGGWVHVAAFRDCEWYWCARHAAIGHRGQNIENSGGGSAPDSGPALERASDPKTLRGASETRRIEAVLTRLDEDVVRDLRLAFEPFGIERAWITLQKAFTRGGLNVLQIAERGALGESECRGAYKLKADDAALEPIMVREWFASVLKKHYESHAGELPRAHVLSHIVDDAERRVSGCLSAYEAATTAELRRRLSGAA